VVAAPDPVLELLDGGVMGDRDRLAGFLRVGEARGGLSAADGFPGIADDGLGRKAQRLWNVARLLDELIQKFQEAAVVVEIRRVGQAVLAAGDNGDLQCDFDAVRTQLLGEDFLLGEDMLDALARGGKVANGLERHFGGNVVGIAQEYG